LLQGKKQHLVQLFAYPRRRITMKIKPYILALVSVFILTGINFAQSGPVGITGGRFLIKGGWDAETQNNATLQTDNFLATGTIGGQYSPWNGVCRGNPLGCAFGESFTVPTYPQIFLGGCIGDCYQFISGPFTINGTTYQNAYYRGSFTFSQATFYIPKTTKRKGKMIFKSPFTLTGRLQVCEVSTVNNACPAGKILFDGEVGGHGTLTVLTGIKISNALRPYPLPYLSAEGFEYQFEQ
jgi:hypothetical protein